jgi:chorismate dehydratase
MLKLGRIPFLVCAPYFGGMSNSQWEFMDGSPSQQNLWLSEGKVAASPSSAIEYAKNFDKYEILPHFCTGATDRVGSVLLFSELPLSELKNQEVYFSSASETSVALWQIYAQEVLGFVSKEANSKTEAKASLLIGDEALQAAEKKWPYVYDLASLWYDWKKTPFVFGLWIVRKEVCTKHKAWVRNLKTELKQSFKKFKANMHDFLDAWEAEFPSGLPKHKREAYFACLEYELREPQIKALNEFFSLLHKHKYIEALPPRLDLLYRDLHDNN